VTRGTYKPKGPMARCEVCGRLLPTRSGKIVPHPVPGWRPANPSFAKRLRPPRCPGSYQRV
jgi:hypothetical protein